MDGLASYPPTLVSLVRPTVGGGLLPISLFLISLTASLMVGRVGPILAKDNSAALGEERRGLTTQVLGRQGCRHSPLLRTN